MPCPIRRRAIRANSPRSFPRPPFVQSHQSSVHDPRTRKYFPQRPLRDLHLPNLLQMHQTHGSPSRPHADTPTHLYADNVPRSRPRNTLRASVPVCPRALQQNNPTSPVQNPPSASKSPFRALTTHTFLTERTQTPRAHSPTRPYVHTREHSIRATPLPNIGVHPSPIPGSISPPPFSGSSPSLPQTRPPRRGFDACRSGRWWSIWRWGVLRR